MSIIDMIIESNKITRQIRRNNITRQIRNAKIESWLDGHIESRVILHHINFVWGKKT